MTHSPYDAGAEGTHHGTSTPLAIVPICPNDRTPLAPVAISTANEIRSAVTKARAAQQEWRLLPLGERIAALRGAAKRMLARRSEVIDLARVEMGKVVSEGRFYEALDPLDAVAGWARVVEGAMHRRVRLNPLAFPRKSARVDMVSRGVVGVIAPWNFPVAGIYRSIIPGAAHGQWRRPEAFGVHAAYECLAR